ncbi:hypothetical protein D8T51_22860, partial [Vibrio vulnificus]
YGFLQTPPLASDALAIRIVFPLVRVTPFSFKWTGLPALLGKQRKAAYAAFLLLFTPHLCRFFTLEIATFASQLHRIPTKKSGATSCLTQRKLSRLQNKFTTLCHNPLRI